MTQTITCPKCKITKPTAQFYKNRSRKTGHSGYCKACDNKICRGSKTYNSTKYLTPENRCKHDRDTLRRFYNYPNQCKRRKKKIDFNLTLDQFVELTNSPCYYCGKKSPGKNYVGIDRVDSNGSYTIDNCVPCCSVCNQMKAVTSQSVFLSHIAAITEHQRSKR